MSCFTNELMICIFSIPLLISISFVTISSLILLILTNINLDDIGSKCSKNSKNQSADYKLDECFLPITDLLNNLFGIVLVVSTLIMLLLCLKSNFSSKQKFKHETARLGKLLFELEVTNSALDVENQRVNMRPVNPPLPPQALHPPQVPISRPPNPMAVPPVLPSSLEETNILTESLPNYGSVMGPNPKSNENNFYALERFPSVIAS